MDKLENGKLDGHTWYRDDSDYIQNIKRSRDFMKNQLESYRKMWLIEVEHGHEQCSRIIKLEHVSCEMLAHLIFNNVPKASEFRKRLEDLGVLAESAL